MADKNMMAFCPGTVPGMVQFSQDGMNQGSRTIGSRLDGWLVVFWFFGFSFHHIDPNVNKIRMAWQFRITKPSGHNLQQ